MQATSRLRQRYAVKGHWRYTKNGRFWVKDHSRVDRSNATKKRIAKAMLGENNPAYKNGGRSYRRIAGARPGQLVHHKDKNREHNWSSNLKIIPRKERGMHDIIHDRSQNFHKRHSEDKTEEAMDLEMKWFSGEIDKEEYEKRKKLLERLR